MKIYDSSSPFLKIVKILSIKLFKSICHGCKNLITPFTPINNNKGIENASADFCKRQYSASLSKLNVFAEQCLSG